MARIWHDGFEYARPAYGHSTIDLYLDSPYRIFRAGSYFSNYGYSGVSTDYATSGDYSLRIRTDSSYSRISFLLLDLDSAVAEHYGRLEVTVTAMNPATTRELVFFRDGSDNIIASIRFNSDRELLLYVGETEVGKTTFALALQIAYRIEWRLLIDDTGGQFELKINGNSLVSWSGDTKGSNGDMEIFGVGTRSGDGSYDIYVDDLALNDTSGTVNNSWCGKGSILLLKPKGVGNYSQFTPSNNTYDNWELVDEVPHDSDGTYVYSETADHIDTYEMEELVADKGIDPTELVVKAVQVCLTGRYEGVDAHLAPMLRSGTTDHEGAQMTMASSYYRLFAEMFSINPFTSAAWAYAEVDGLEAGIKHKAHVE